MIFILSHLISINEALATSTAVERAFSQGRQILHFTRNRLKPSAIHAHLCLGSWARLGLISATDFVRAIQAESSKRKRDDNDDDAGAAAL